MFKLYLIDRHNNPMIFFNFIDLTLFLYAEKDKVL